ncbi:MAG: acyloxyacyl hydrolase [Muribaculaceae bacterium]|nr:acyloxyacyl hydrolase [Muribaculaceae bacterium]
MKRYIIVAVLVTLIYNFATASDTIPSGFSLPLRWRAGTDITAGWVAGTCAFLRGENPSDARINSTMSVDARVDFSFNTKTYQGILYKGLYQGIGINANTFFHGKTLGTPVSVYVYQGAPFATIGKHLRAGYEWQFGTAIGWKPYTEQYIDNQAPVSTHVTAHMAVSAKIHYDLTERLEISAGVNLKHYSNGNTSWPNRGVNTVGAEIGIAYSLNSKDDVTTPSDVIITDADKGKWMYDILAFGAWRKRTLIVDNTPNILPGKFGVIGMQFSPMRKLNRYVAVGPALDIFWDESADLARNWVEGSYGENILFYRPAFGKQISAGASAHAELTMPIFKINAGLGYDFVKPNGERRFYQSLAIKAFISRHIFLNIGYRLARFQDPQNLMLGIGVRL